MVDGFIQTNSLIYFNISNNHLKSLPENIKNLTSLKTLKISGNKFKCSCKSFWMKEWLLNETRVVEDFENIKCQMNSGKWISVVHMDKTEMGCMDSSGDTFSIWNILSRFTILVFSPFSPLCTLFSFCIMFVSLCSVTHFFNFSNCYSYNTDSHHSNSNW